MPRSTHRRAPASEALRQGKQEWATIAAVAGVIMVLAVGFFLLFR